MNKFGYTILLVSVILTVIYIFSPTKVYQPDGILVNDSPKQIFVHNEPIWEYKEYDIEALAEISLKARVLSKKYYSSDRESDISPIDLALGWGKMSDSKVLDKIDISQKLRWYFWKTPKFPIPRKEIELSSANMHIIPSSDKIEDVLDDIRIGNVIQLSGKLVEVTAEDGYRWRSSLSRSDDGNGACEVVWVEEISILK
jgi:hypothetical protein